MQRRRLGRTGHESSVAILGGAAFALSTTDEAEPAFAAALARGVNDLDTVMFPVYPRLWADVDYRRAAEELLSICSARDLGVMAIKAVARQPWGQDDSDRFATTWYEPRREPESIARGVHFALSTPGV